MALSECTWLMDNPPEEPKTFWNEGYPSMATVDENCRRAERAGFTVLDSLVLPASAWWNDYYTPLLELITHLRPTADAGLTALLDDTEREIDLFRRHGDCYGYVFYLPRK